MRIFISCIYAFIISLKSINKMKSLILLFSSLLLFISCKVEPKEINYGKDHCYHCDMTVVDKTHAAQYVTEKGRAYTFDAVECMVLKLNDDKNESNMAFLLVSDYLNPGSLIDAKSATYLISDKIKSPMGANLSAFSSLKEAQKTLKKNGGTLYSWSELKKKLTK